MLETCFTHLPGIGPATQAKLAAAGIYCWEDALCKPLPMSERKAAALKVGIAKSQHHLNMKNFRWFCRALKSAEHWRLFPYCKDKAAYVDIETNGLSLEECYITSIALYDGREVRTYVQGENLEAFADDILDYSLLVTWNGRCFDAPILRKSLSIPLDSPQGGHMAHLDLLPVFRGMSLRGGLKKVERLLGLDRDDLDGVDGWAAVRLWRAYEQTDDRRFLETLLAYNVADVLSLERLAEYAVVCIGSGTPTAENAFPDMMELGIDPVCRDANPYVPDKDVLAWLQGRCSLPNVG